MELRQLLAVSARSDGRSSNCTSFSASAKVAGETSGPTGGAVPKAGGAPAGSSFDIYLLLALQIPLQIFRPKTVRHRRLPIDPPAPHHLGQRLLHRHHPLIPP